MIKHELEIRQMPVAQLIPAPYNPRRQLSEDAPAYRKLVASLTEFGLVEPLVWNEATGHVVGGHLRLRILKSLGTEQIPVSVVRLDPAREKALNIVLNNREVQGRFDPEKLSDLLAELEELPELELTGFDRSDLAALRFEPQDTPAPEEDLGLVEVIIRLDSELFDRVSPQIDALVREYDLVCHVRRGQRADHFQSRATKMTQTQ